MRYDVMRVICFFDLPTETAVEKRAYRYFRKHLLENGFEMLQYSVYIRACPNREYAKKYYRRLREKAPLNGHIRLLMITEKQFDDMFLIIGTKTHQEEVIGSHRLVVI